MKKTAAVIVTWNRKELLLECISAVLSQEGGAPDVIVVDNASSDGTEEALRPYAERKEILYFNTGSNLGGAGGFHYGIRRAVELGYDYFWIMDDDCVPTKTALSCLISAAREDPDFGFLSSKVLWKDGSICRMNVQRETLTGNVTDFRRKRIPAAMASFVSLFLRADVVREMGLPIKEFFIWTDDWEYTRRISRKYPCWVITDSVVVHKSKTNIAADISRESADRLDRFYYLYRNDVVLYRREGFRGFAYECVRLAGHCVRILLRSKDHKLLRIGKIFRGTAAGLRFRPEIEYAETVPPLPEAQKNRKIRILEAFGEPVADGGQESFVFNTLENMDRTGLQIDFLTAYDVRSAHYHSMAKQMGGRVYALHLPFAPGKSRFNIAVPFRAFLRKHHYDVIHIHSGSISVLAIMSAEADKAGTKKVIVHSHASGEADSVKHRMLRLAASLSLRRHADVYCACSKAAAAWKFEPRYAYRAKIIKNGIDAGRFSFDPEIRSRMREKLGLSGCFVVGHVGRFTKEKNHSFLVEVFEKLHRKNPQSRLLLVGEGEGMGEIREKVRKKGLADTVVFTGSVSNVQDYLQAMDVFVLPSRFEGLGIAALEAQCSGLPVIASDRVPEDVKTAEHVRFLSLDKSPEEWAREIVEIGRQGAAGREKTPAMSAYDVKKTAAVLRDLYLRQERKLGDGK